MVNNMAAWGRMKLKVHLDENGRISEVFVSPTTKCKDIVLRLQRQIRQTNCCLVEVWQECERLVPEDELIQSTLLEWDTDLDEVSFYLRPNDDTVSPAVLDSLTHDIQLVEENIPLAHVSHNGLHDNYDTRIVGSNRPTVQELQELAARQQREIELREQQLADKEQQLKDVKQRTRQKIRSTYVDQLETQIHEQDKKMRHLRRLQDEIENYRLGNVSLDDELQSMEALFNTKEQELAVAAAKVDGLTKQLNEQQQKWNTIPKQKEKSKEEMEVERLRQELMTRNELNHQQSIQMQAQKQLFAEKHKELIELDSQIDQLTSELRKKKTSRVVHVNTASNLPHENGNAAHTELDHFHHEPENGLWENGESFDWSEFVDSTDTYDEEMHLNYNDSSNDDNGQRSQNRQNNSRLLETLVEEEEPSTGTSKASYKEESNQKPLFPRGTKTRVSKLATFFEGEGAAKNDQVARDEKSDTRKISVEIERSLNDGALESKTFFVESRSPSKVVEKSKDSSRFPMVDRDADRQYDGAFNRSVGTGSPLSSPSSLSSLSSFSSTSSASRATKHEEPRASLADNALKSREIKTEGLETSTAYTSGKSRLFYEAEVSREAKYEPERLPDQNMHGNEPNYVSDSSTRFGNVHSSLQQLKSMAMSLKEPGKTPGRENVISKPLDSIEDLPESPRTVTDILVKPTGTSFIPKQSETTASSRDTSPPSVAMVFASQPVRYTLAEESERARSKNQTGREKLAGEDARDTITSSEPSDNKIVKAVYRKLGNPEVPLKKGTSRGTVSKVKITLVSSGARSVPSARESTLDRSNSNDMKTEDQIRTGRPHSANNEPNDVTTRSTVDVSDKDRFEGSENMNKYRRLRAARVFPISSSKVFTSPSHELNTVSSEANISRLQEDDLVVTAHPVGVMPTQNMHTVSTMVHTNQRDVIARSQQSGRSVVIRDTAQNSASPGNKKKSRHVSLDPHAVLLDAAVEGELEQVRRVIKDVDDPSLANTDGITALHNAVCGDHAHVVRFLVEYGCDVNLPDSHGWTPLHCSAASNNLSIVRYLVENGACIFAITGLQKKTPVQCCEMSVPGYQECVEYLQDIQYNFGMACAGKVYALYAYNAIEKDELSFECGEELHVLRRGDSNELEWWWAKNGLQQAGYIPRNLLGMYPRVAPEV